MRHFPDGFQCGTSLCELYEQLEPQLLPIIRAKARRFRAIPGVDYDDAVQEGRLAVLSALAAYDTTRATSVGSYIGVVLDNTFNELMAAMLAQRRCPHQWSHSHFTGPLEYKPTHPFSIHHGEGEHRPKDGSASWATELVDPRPHPEDVVIFHQAEQEVQEFKLLVLGHLEGRMLDVFLLKVDPPARLLDGARDGSGQQRSPTNVEIARFLGCSKNQVDWALYKVRMLVAQLLEDTGFSGLDTAAEVHSGWADVIQLWLDRAAAQAG